MAIGTAQSIVKNDRAKVRELSQGIVREPVAYVEIEWSSALVDDETTVTTPNDFNRINRKSQVADGSGINKYKWFHCDFNRLDGSFCAMPENETPRSPVIDPIFQVGWRGNHFSDSNGNFTDYPKIEVSHTPRTFTKIIVTGDKPTGEYPLRWILKLYTLNVLQKTYEISEIGAGITFDLENVSWEFTLPVPVADIDSYAIQIIQWSEPNTFVKITECYSNIEFMYESDMINTMSILEETEGSVGTIPVGGISCNSIDLSLQNITNEFFPFNSASPLNGFITRNRRIQPYVGFRDSESGTDYVLPKGLYWSGEWTSAEQSAEITTSGYDRLMQLQNIPYNGFKAGEAEADGYTDGDGRTDATCTHWKDISLYDLINRLLNYVRLHPDYRMLDMVWDIDGTYLKPNEPSSLRDIKIPIAYFESGNFFELLQQIMQVGLAYAYMDSPTVEEVAQAKQDGIANLRDILRIKSLETALQKPPEDGQGFVADWTEYGVITAKDYITRSHPEKRDELANVISIKVHEIEIDRATGKAVVDNVKTFTHISDSSLAAQSIRRYGRALYKVPDNHLIQKERTEKYKRITENLLDRFSETYQVQELTTFGDPSLRITDILQVPEYHEWNPRQNDASVLSENIYAVTRIATEFDGGLRQNLTVRKLGGRYDHVGYIDEQHDTGYDIIDEQPVNDSNPNLINEQ